MDEVAACGAACGAGEGFMCNPMSGVCQAQGQFIVSPAHPYVSTASMVAPSPDWCAFPILALFLITFRLARHAALQPVSLWCFEIIK